MLIESYVALKIVALKSFFSKVCEREERIVFNITEEATIRLSVLAKVSGKRADCNEAGSRA